MSRLFDLDSPLLSFLSRVGDLIWLNLLTVVCCIPVVTAGAALTALHYVTIKMVRNEEGYLTRSYFKSFKENFLQATALWLLMLLLWAVAAGDFYFLSMMEGGAADIMRIGLCAVFVFFLCSSIYWLPLLSRFDNSIKNTVKNACLIGISNLPKSICLLLIYAAFAALYWVFLVRLLPLIFLFGISAPAYLSAYLYSGIFKRLEPPEEGDVGQSV